MENRVDYSSLKSTVILFRVGSRDAIASRYKN